MILAMRWMPLLLGLSFTIVSCEGKKEKPPTRKTTTSPSTPTPTRKTTQPHTGHAAQKTKPLNADAIGKAAGTKATAGADGVVRIGWGRNDVAVRIDGMAFPAAAGLGSWAAFAPMGDQAMVMGDTVVFQDEITPAIDAAFANGLEVSALHNHFVFDEPAVFFMHIGGHGAPEKLAAGVKAMWDAIKAVRKASPQPARTFPGPTVKPGKLDAAKLGEIIGRKAGTPPGGVVKVVVPRQASMGGLTFGGSMGLTTWAAFVGDMKLASIDGDFAMTAREVQPVLRALRAAKIHVVALHNHMIGETPAYYFVHFWGKGPAENLARGFRAALDAQATAK